MHEKWMDTADSDHGDSLIGIPTRSRNTHHAPEGVLRVTLKAMALTGRAAGLEARMGLAAKAFLEKIDCIFCSDFDKKRVQRVPTQGPHQRPFFRTILA